MNVECLLVSCYGILLHSLSNIVPTSQMKTHALGLAGNVWPRLMVWLFKIIHKASNIVDSGRVFHFLTVHWKNRIV